MLGKLNEGAQIGISLLQLVWSMLPSYLQIILGIMLISSLLWTFGITLLALKGSGIHLAESAVGSLTLHVWGTNQSDVFEQCSPLLNQSAITNFESCANWNTTAMEHPPVFCNQTLWGIQACWEFLPAEYACECDGDTIRFENGSIRVNCTGDSGTIQSCEQVAFTACAPIGLIEFEDCYNSESEAGSLYLLTLSPLSESWPPPPGNWFYVLTCCYLAAFALKTYSAGRLLG